MPSLDQLYEVLANDAARLVGAASSRLATHARQLVRPVSAVAPELTNAEVMGFLTAHEDVSVLPVVADGVPVGLVNRSAFLESFVKPFAKEVYGRKPCTTWMDPAPLVVEGGTPVEELMARAVAAGGRVLRDGFVTTEGGRYTGLGSGHALLEAMSALEAEKTRRLLESIDYASMIQRAHLRASDAELAAALADQALAWEPRDVVGGDCYFFRRVGGGLFGAVLDCTGHGVPGAFMTLIALSFLDQWVGPAARDPGAALEGLNRHIKRVLGQAAGDGAEPGGGARRSDDGLDGACFFLPDGGDALEFAGARLPLLVAAPGVAAAAVVEGERASVGYQDTPADQRWPARRVALPPGALVAVATDGLYDQVGGFKHIALGRRRTSELLAAAAGSSAAVARDGLLEALAAWQGGEPRRDDVTLLLLRARSPA